MVWTRIKPSFGSHFSYPLLPISFIITYDNTSSIILFPKYCHLTSVFPMLKFFLVLEEYMSSAWLEYRKWPQKCHFLEITQIRNINNVQNLYIKVLRIVLWGQLLWEHNKLSWQTIVLLGSLESITLKKVRAWQVKMRSMVTSYSLVYTEYVILLRT